MTERFYRWRNRGSLKLNTQGLIAGQGWWGTSPSPQYPGLVLLFHTGVWVHMQHCGQIEETQEKNPPSAISIFWGWRTFSTQLGGIWIPDVLASPACRHTAGVWWMATFESPVLLSVPRNRRQQWDLTSKDCWPQMEIGHGPLGCHTDHITWKLDYCHVLGKPWLAVSDTSVFMNYVISFADFQLPTKPVEKVHVRSAQSLTISLLFLQKALPVSSQREELPLLALFFLSWAWVVETIEGRGPRTASLPCSPAADNPIQSTSAE